MRFKHPRKKREWHKSGTRRVVLRFLWWPTRKWNFDDRAWETRWLVTTEVTQEFQHYKYSNKRPQWVDKYWATPEDVADGSSG